jgi:hypothetical protein
VLVPVIGRRLIARVASGPDVGAHLSASVYLLRADAATIDPWFLAGLLSSSDGQRQAARMTSALGHEIRFDPRRVRIPLPPIDLQRLYGDTFRRLSGFADALRLVHDQGVDIIRAMTDATVSELASATHDQRASVRGN